MPKRSHLLLLTIAVDAMLLVGTMQAQADEPEDDPPLIIQIQEQSPSSTVSSTFSAPVFSSINAINSPAQ